MLYFLKDFVVENLIVTTDFGSNESKNNYFLILVYLRSCFFTLQGIFFIAEVFLNFESILVIFLQNKDFLLHVLIDSQEEQRKLLLEHMLHKVSITLIRKLSEPRGLLTIFRSKAVSAENMVLVIKAGERRMT